jgi:hypothetical protein
VKQVDGDCVVGTGLNSQVKLSSAPHLKGPTCLDHILQAESPLARQLVQKAVAIRIACFLKCEQEGL